MTYKWTLEQRLRRAELIRQWKPWEQSTGPITAEGKLKSSQNAYKGGIRQELRSLTQALRQSQKALAEVTKSIGKGHHN